MESLSVVEYDWLTVGVPDWAFGAHQQVADIAEQLEGDSAHLAELRKAYSVAAQALQGQDWESFLEGLACRTHGDDKGVHAVLGSLLGSVEPSWASILKKQPKLTGENARVLFLGDPPSEQLCSIFQFNHWTGVFAGRGACPWCEVTNIGAMPENPGRPLTATWIELDEEEESQKSYKCFEFIYINSMFQSNATKTLKDEVVLPLIGAGLPPVRKVHYGARLREFREHLYTALQKLANKGTLCMAWSGPPCHPVLFFIASQLRACFKRVRIVTPKDAGSFEIYILAVEFEKTRKVKLPIKGTKDTVYAAFEHFLAISQRSSGCDDILCWCPTRATLMTEYEGAKADYEDVFWQFANKVKAVSEEVGAASLKKKKTDIMTQSGLFFHQLATANLQQLEAQGTKLPRLGMSSEDFFKRSKEFFHPVR